MRALILHSLILFLSTTYGYSQKLIFENIGVRSGLPSTEVYHVFQDPKGYIWVFTEYGIVKYDGSRFSHVCKNIPLTERIVYSVFQKKGGFLYFGNSKANIYCVKNDFAYKVKGLEKSRKEIQNIGENILDLFVDNNNTLYFSTNYDTYRYSKNKYSISGNLKETSLKDSGMRYLGFKKFVKEKPSVNIVILDQNGRKYSSRTRVICRRTRVLVRKIGNEFYQTTQESVAVLRNGQVKKNIDFDTEIIDFQVDKEKHLWVGLVNGGLYELNRDLKIVSHYFDRLTVSSILFDDQNGLWVSTIENGVYHCKDIKMKSYRNIDLLNSSISMVKCLNGKLFIGTYKGNLFVKEGETFKRINLDDNLLAVTDIECYSGHYLVGTTQYLFLLNEKFDILSKKDGASFGISWIDNDKALLVYPTSIGIYNRETDKLLVRAYSKGKTRCIVKNKRKEHFIISGNGILKMKDFKFELPKELQKLKDENIVRLEMDKQDNLWLCSKGSGLYCWTKNNKLIHYMNLPTTFVSDVDFTENGYIVISTNLGTFVNRRKTINEDSWDLIFKEESLKNNVFEGVLYIGSKFGLTSISVNELERKKPHQFYLKEVLYKGKSIPLQRGLTVNYDQNNLNFHYDLLNYQSNNNQLEYALEGPMKLNGLINGTQIQLQNLSPGEYTLKVKPIMMNIRGSHLSITTKFTIRPAFWQTWVFLVVVVIIVCSLVFLIFWWISNRRNKRLQEVNQIENLLTEYRLTALKSQVNPHFMSNSLVAIQRLILENETDKANQYIAKFSLLLRSLLEYSSRSSASLKNELNMIELYVELEQLRFDHQFVFEVQIGDEVNLSDIYMPALITQPFVENAIWHGLLPLDGKKEAKLILSIQDVENGILISVIDNGVGREANKIKKNHREFESKGTSLIMQRIENLNRLYNTVGGRIEYIDLKDDQNQPIGTQVNIWLPNEILTQLYDGRNS